MANQQQTRPSQGAAAPAQLALRSALAPYLDENDPRALIESLERIQNDTAKDSPLRSMANQTLIQRLIVLLKDDQRSHGSLARAEHIELLGRFDRWLGWQIGQSPPTDPPRLDQMTQSLIHELDTIELKPRHPLASWIEHQNRGPSEPIHSDFVSPWPATLNQTLNYWACQLAPSTTLALPSVTVKALLDAPALTPIEIIQEAKLWGFHGLEWADTPLPAIALSPPDHYRSPLSVCVLLLQTPREVASNFAYFGLICPTLPSLVPAQELGSDHHQFIDWVAVVREINAVF